jgi:hypothetical protein
LKEEKGVLKAVYDPEELRRYREEHGIASGQGEGERGSGPDPAQREGMAIPRPHSSPHDGPVVFRPMGMEEGRRGSLALGPVPTLNSGPGQQRHQILTPVPIPFTDHPAPNSTDPPPFPMSMPMPIPIGPVSSNQNQNQNQNQYHSRNHPYGPVGAQQYLPTGGGW